MRTRHLLIGAGGFAAAAIAVKLLTRPSNVDWDEVGQSIPHFENSHFAEIDGIRIHFQQFGEKTEPPIILIHGYTASVYVWKSVAPLLAQAGFCVIAIDLVGFGYSEKPAWFAYTIDAQARMIARFMDRFGIGQAVIVGSSYGGAVAATLALDYPARVEKLVLVDAVINDEVKKHPILRLAAVPGIGEIITPFLIDSTSFMRFRMHRTLSPANQHMITKERVRFVQQPLTNAGGHRAALATSRNWRADRIEADCHLINQPTLLIWGEDDQIIPIESGYKLFESILHSRLVVLKSCGHIPQEEKSTIFVDIVGKFCADPASIGASDVVGEQEVA